MAQTELFFDGFNERAVLGAMFIDRHAVDYCMGHVEKDFFYDYYNAEVFTAIQALYKKEQPIDPLSVASQIKATRGGDNEVDLTQLVSFSIDCPSSSNISSYTGTLRELYNKRQLLIGLTQAQTLLKSGSDVDDVIATFSKAAEAQLDDSFDQKFLSLEDLAHGMYDDSVSILERLKRGEVINRSIKYGFQSLDVYTRGMMPNNLVVIGARPGGAKTATALNIALNIAAQGKKVIFFSLEMSHRELFLRLFSCVTSKKSFHMIDYDITDKDIADLDSFQKWCEGNSLYIYEAATLTPDSMLSIAKMQGADVVIVDYLQLMSTGKRHNRYEEVTELARGMKRTAQQLKITVVALSQLSRDSAKRPDKTPVTADLRESGEIEQAADVILLLHRPCMYDDVSYDEKQLDMILAKNRHGPVGKVELLFTPEFSKVEEPLF